jgi:hypothetical protein
MLIKLVTYFKYAFVAFMLIFSVCSFANMPPEALKYDISNIPPKYQENVEVALTSWQVLKKQEAAFYKVLAYEIHGDNRPFALGMIDAPLAHFIYPWSLNNQFPFATTHNTPYFTHYVPLNRMEDIGQITGKLDAVFVDGEGGIDSKDFQLNRKPIQVHLKKEAGEITLLLSSERNADWDITWDEGVTVKKIIIPSTMWRFRIKTQTPNIEIVKSKYTIKRFDESFRIDHAKALNIDGNFYQSYANNVKEATGIAPRSIWFGKKTNSITIDGKNNAKTTPTTPPLPLSYQDTEYPNYDQVKEYISVTDGYQIYEKQLKVLDDRTIGRWYWEIEYKLLTPSGLRAYYDAGAGHYGAKFPTKIATIIKNKDVMQFALDLDNSYLYIGLNGNWIVGNPAQKGSGVRLAPNLAHSPFLSINGDIDDKSKRPSAMVNFGATQFNYQSPANYLPYDSRFSEARKIDTIKNKLPYQFQKEDLELAQFPTPIYQRTSPQFKSAWQNFQKAIVDYRQSACALTYAYKTTMTVSANNLDPQCVWFIKGYFGNSMDFPTVELQNSQGRAKEKLPTIEIKNAKLHFIRKYGVGQRNHELKPINLKVTDTSAPLILFIYAYEPMLWNIELAKGVKVRQIIMYGQRSHQQYIISKKVNIPVNLYSDEDRTSGIIWPAMHAGQPSTSAMSEQLKILIGLTPSTLQKKCENDECLIDGTLGADYLIKNEPFP